MNSKFNRNQRFNNGSSRQHRTNYNCNGRRERFVKPQIICQLHDKVGHSAKTCCVVSSDKSMNCATTGGSNNKKWLVTQLLFKTLHLILPIYLFTQSMMALMKLSLEMAQVCKSHMLALWLFPSFSKPFKLTNILCVPNIHQNLIYVHNFTRSNNVFIDFHPFYFLVKDQSTEATLFCDEYHEGVYPILMTFSSIKSFVLALVCGRTIFIIWHRWFGHPLNKIVDLIIHRFLFQL